MLLSIPCLVSDSKIKVLALVPCTCTVRKMVKQCNNKKKREPLQNNKKVKYRETHKIHMISLISSNVDFF